MEAIQFDPLKKTLTLVKAELPSKINSDEVLVKVAYSGVCGTDLHIIEGKFPCCNNQLILGHEFSGIVSSLGSDVKHIQKGDRVAVDPNSFTFLRSQSSEPTVQVAPIRQRNFHEQQATARNRRLAQQMERRPTVLAALKLKRRSLKQRLGIATGSQFVSIKDRLLLNRGGFRGKRGNIRGQGISPLRQNRGRGGFGGGGRGGRLPRSLSTSSLSRSQSMQSLSGRSVGGSSGRGKFRGRGQSRGGSVQRSAIGRMNNRRGNRGAVRGSFQGNDNFRNRRGSPSARFNTRGGGRGGMRGGSFRGRGGRGRGRGMRNSGSSLTKEELDSQLDQYMANTKVYLDKELDSYMNQGKEDEEMWD